MADMSDVSAGVGGDSGCVVRACRGVGECRGTRNDAPHATRAITATVCKRVDRRRPAALGGADGGQRCLAHAAIEPRPDVGRSGTLPQQIDKRLLHGIFGLLRVEPLPGVEHQRSGVTVEPLGEAGVERRRHSHGYNAAEGEISGNCFWEIEAK